MFHIQGIKKEKAYVTSQKNFDGLMGTSSEAPAHEAFAQMDVHLDLRMQRLLEALQDRKF